MKNLFYTALGIFGIIGALSLGIVNASDYVTTIPGLVVTGEQDGQVFEYGVLKFDDGSGHVITLLDRNLGATMTGAGVGANTGSYGYKYQWGNNHGFKDGCFKNNGAVCSDSVTTNATGTGVEYSSDYNNYNYSGSTFIQGWSSRGYDYWNSGHYANLRGGGNDTSANQRGLSGKTEQNIKNRQGPCPDGYHVPSVQERNNLFVYWYNTEKGGNLSTTNLQGKSETNVGKDLAELFYIPFAGFRSHSSAALSDQNEIAFFWTSSPSNVNGSYYPYIMDMYVNIGGHDSRADGRSVRCFSNDYLFPKHSVIFYDGEGEIASGTVTEGDTRSEDIPTPDTKTGYNFEYRYIDGWDDTTGFDFSTPITSDLVLQAKWSCATGYKDNGGVCVINKDIVIEATATEAGQTIKINKYFANAYTVDWGDGNTGNLTADTGHSYDVASGFTITLSTTANRWTFQNQSKQLIPKDGTTMTGVKIIYMPSLADGFGANATAPGNYFFRNFNRQGAITTLPEGSFDTSNITTAGNYFFRNFNRQGAITTLPEGSFDISNISGTVGNNFFAYFNYNGALASLSTGSFDTSNITKVGSYFFGGFNENGALTSLPEGSFRFSTGLTTANAEFFECFNTNGALTSLPTGSFNIDSITTAGFCFFCSFNSRGALASLPEGSFNTNNITAEDHQFFNYFNYSGALTSLPEGSFRLATGLTTTKNFFFQEFNAYGALTSLPEGSFDTSNISGAGANFFYQFNYNGKITSLPEGSFDTSKITMAEGDFFSQFNAYGALTSLPEGSFRLSTGLLVISGVWSFFRGFNQSGAIINIPDSFTMNPVGASGHRYENAFNSPNYTFNRKVSNLVADIAVPTLDMNTFSDNQPGRCGVHPNWLVTKANACSISYDNGLGGTGEFKYNADTTGVVVGSGITAPTREGYTFSGWIDASGNNVEEVIFPDMDGQTLYANWIANEYTIVFVDGSGTETEVIYTGAYESTVTTDYPEWTKEGYTIHWDKEIPDTMPLSGETITASWTINQYTIKFDVDGAITTITGEYGSPITPPANPTKNGYTFKGWEPEIPATMPAEDLDIKATWNKNGSSGGGGGGGGGSSSSNTGSATSQTGSQIDSNTGSTASGTNEKEPEGTGNNAEIQTGSQVDSQPDEQTPEQLPQNVDKDIQDSSDNASEGQNYSEEFQQAYEFAKGKGITTMPTIQKANMNGPLTRIAMAKMLSQYAINVLGQKAENTVVPKFNDVTDKQNSDYDNGVTLAYQLGIMGQNMPNNNFRPTDEVTRAEFATALSRMLYNTSDGEYKSTPKYYTHHMEKLVKEGIITKDDPAMKELRGYVMIMLMRSAK